MGILNLCCLLYVFRYEQKWLPLAAENLHKVLVAPLDIEWIWYVHMMDPIAYEEDCKIVTGGKVIDHKLLSGPERKKHIEMTRDLWNRSYPGEIFYVDLNDPDPPVDPTFRSNLKYDLEAAVVNEMVFNYQVALPHFSDEIFLKEAIKRYWFMLMIYKESSQVPVVPYFDNGLVWHAHMAHPKTYKKETIQLFYYILPHKYTDSVRLPGTESWERIAVARRVWDERKKAMAISGGMFRGTPPTPGPARNPERYTSYAHKAYNLQPRELRIQNLEEGTYRAVIKCESKASDLTQTFIVYDSGFGALTKTFLQKFNMSKDESKFILNTDRFYGLSVSLYKHVNESLYESYVATTDFPPSSFVGKKVSDFTMPLSLKFAGFIDKKGAQPPKREYPQFACTLSLYCPSIKSGSYHLRVEKKQRVFRKCPSLIDLLQLPGIVVPFHLGKKDINCHYEDYCVLGSLGDPAFHLRIVHCLSPKVSVIEVADFNSDMVANAHIVDNGTLPNVIQVSDPKFCATLSPQTQRAIVIRSENCDWAILRASWQGYRKFFSPGYLAAELFVLGLHPKKWIPFQCSGYKHTTFVIDLAAYKHVKGSVTVDIKNATTTFEGNVTCVPELVCLSASLAVLFTLCQPRDAPPVDDKGAAITYSSFPKKSYKLDVDELAYVVRAGLYCPSLPRTYEN